MTTEEKEHLMLVASFGCIACEKIGFYGTPAEIHHVRFKSGAAQRASHYDVLPLCAHHHRLGGYGEAFHAGPSEWQRKFGTEKDLLDEIKNRSRCRE